MTTKDISLKQALNKAYRLIKPKRPEMEVFKKNLIILLGQIDEKESEENVKIHLMNFLRDTFYNPTYHVATKGRTDFVIHTGKEASTAAGVLFEVKRPLNTADMVSKANLNAKAMHELMLYYLRERIEHKNNNIRQLAITNIYEWFIFDASVFERLFHKNTQLVKQYKEWTANQKVSSSTDLFYKEIAKPFLDELEEEIPFTWFDIREFDKPLRNTDKEDDNKLIALFKVFSPTHLLKLPFANDSNSLDKGFYTELLYIIGLEEVKEGSKKIIRRKKEGNRNEGSLLENTIAILETENCLHKVPDLKSYGETKEEQLFSVGLELCITWVNRILFLKLLEAQLLKYHKGDNQYRFLNFAHLPQYDEVYKLFFQVLARRHDERIEKVKKKFSQIPYLNSSLFEFSEMEEATIKINMLDDTAELDLITSTVLRNDKNKAKAPKLNTLQYFFEFLDAYDFASEGSEEIQEESKTLINASVLGLIFEKINGYKDGSIFTPGFITMYMCRQSIRQAVVNKFKEKYNWKAETFDDLYNYISEDRSTKKLKEYNELINSLTICDPAVGSGHFPVSALNELIAIKAELGILISEQGTRLSDIEITLENDELIITDKQGDIFQYIVEPDDETKQYIQPWKQTVQKTLFHEKQTIIENCLFGVDINPKSVQICRLRLWIELLKNAYYIIPEGQPQNSGRLSHELQTLPNIDINIKCGNSLISRFSLTEDLKSATPYFEKKILEYKSWVADYKHEVDKDKKRGIQQLMTDLKKGFLSKITDRNPTKIKLDKLTAEFLNKYVNEKLFSDNLTAAQKKDKERLDKEIEKLNTELEAYIKSPVYSNAFEWRFEFPEVLNDKGDFVGFDLIIGNPPYISAWEMHSSDEQLREIIKERFPRFKKQLKGHWDLYMAFIVLSIELSKSNGRCSFIIPNPFLREKYASALREYLLKEINLSSIVLFEDTNVFEDVARRTIIISFNKNINKAEDVSISVTDAENSKIEVSGYIKKTDWAKSSDSRFNINTDNNLYSQLSKIEEKSVHVGNICYINYGAQVSSKEKGGYSKSEVISKEPKGNAKNFIEGKDVQRWQIRSRGLWLDYRSDSMYGARFVELFQTPKIIIRKISDRKHRIAAAIDNEGFYTDDGCVLAVPFKSFQIENEKIQHFGYEEIETNLTLPSILSQLLSNLVTFYFKFKFSTESLQGETSHTYPKSVRELPLLNLSKKDEKTLSDYGKQLFEEYESKDLQRIKNIEDLINQFIYNKYGLSDEEINFIEKSIK